MALTHKTRIKQSKYAHTQYLVIPSAMVRDSQYPFKKNEEVEIVVDPEEKKVTILHAKKNE
jgi:hypothetical protein